MHLPLFRSLSVTTPRALACAFAFVVSSAAGIAAVITTDDFNNNAINPLLWQTNGSETLVETNQRIEFNPSSVSGGQWYLTSTLSLPTDQNWTVQIDVAHLAATADFSFIGLALFQIGTNNSLHYLVSRPGQLSASDPELSAYFTTDGSYTDAFGTSQGVFNVLRIGKFGNTFSLLRGTYSAITGYSFIAFRTYDFHGTGGGNASADWNTQPGETFTLRLTASASEQIASGQMTFDNFYAETPTAPIPEPATAAALAGVFALGLAVSRRRISRRPTP
jgi:hypothetical protein